jgi:hypothetical protein
MRRIATILTTLLLLVSEAYGGTITLNFGSAQTLTTTPAQDAALGRIRTFLNTQRAPADQYATIEAMLRDILLTALTSYRDQATELIRDDACAHYRSLTPAQRTTIDANFGPAGSPRSPCP